MADPPRHPDTGVGPDRGSPPRMPRWVKWSGIVIGVLILLFVSLQIAGVGGEHGPGRHGLGGAQPPAAVTAEYPPPENGTGGHDRSTWGQ